MRGFVEALLHAQVVRKIDHAAQRHFSQPVGLGQVPARTHVPFRFVELEQRGLGPREGEQGPRARRIVTGVVGGLQRRHRLRACLLVVPGEAERSYRGEPRHRSSHGVGGPRLDGEEVEGQRFVVAAP